MNVRSYCLLSDPKKTHYLNNVGVLVKSVLIDLCARNFVHAKTSLHAHCMHARHHVCNLLSPDDIVVFTYIWTAQSLT